jgi:hypothetical protein
MFSDEGSFAADQFSDEESAVRQRERHAELCAGPQPEVLHGPGYLYRPGQVLVEVSDTREFARAENVLGLRGAVPHAELDRSFAAAGLPVLALALPAEVDIPALVSELRLSRDGEPVPNVAPNYVFCGEPDYHGGPAGEPSNARPFSEAPYSAPEQKPPSIAVLDTGYDPAVQELHAGLGWRLDYTAADQEDALAADGYLAPEGGHGTFIDGILMRLAPQARIRQVKVLDPAGVGDDATVAIGLATAAAPVVNVSLGGYTHEDRPPVALGAALAQHADDVVVVAAAGNNHQGRPFWPAAFSQVVAVGALDTRQEPPGLAKFSNYGWWVDVYVPGVRICSTYLRAAWKLRQDPEPRPLDGYAYWSGTSFAAPQVAALIANEIPAAGTARRAAYAVLAAAQWLPGVGPVLIPHPGVAG